MITLENIIINPAQLSVAKQIFSQDDIESIANKELKSRQVALANLTQEFASHQKEEQRLLGAYTVSTTECRNNAKLATKKYSEQLDEIKEVKSASIIGKLMLRVAPNYELRREIANLVEAKNYEVELETHISELDSKIALQREHLKLKETAIAHAQNAVNAFQANEDVRATYVSEKVNQTIAAVIDDYDRVTEFFPPLTGSLQDRTAVLRKTLEKVPSEKKISYFVDVETRTKDMHSIVQKQIRETLVEYLNGDTSVEASEQLIKMGEMDMGARKLLVLTSDYRTRVPEELTLQVANYFIAKGETKSGVQVLSRHKENFLKNPESSINMLKGSPQAIREYVNVYSSRTTSGRIYNNDSYHEPGVASKELAQALTKYGFNDLALDAYDTASSYFTACGCSDMALGVIAKLPEHDSRRQNAKRSLMYNNLGRERGNMTLSAALAIELKDKDVVLQLAPRVYDLKKRFDQYGSEWKEFISFAQTTGDNTFIAKMYEIGEDPINAMKYQNKIQTSNTKTNSGESK